MVNKYNMSNTYSILVCIIFLLFSYSAIRIMLVISFPHKEVTYIGFICYISKNNALAGILTLFPE